MSKRRLIYEARKNGELITRGTAKEMAAYFGVTLSIIGNCERCGRKIHGEYEIERDENDNHDNTGHGR